MKYLIFFIQLISFSLLINGQVDSLNTVYVMGYREHTNISKIEGENKYIYSFENIEKELDSISFDYCSFIIKNTRKANKILNIFYKYKEQKSEPNKGNDYSFVAILKFRNSTHNIAFKEGVKTYIYIDEQKIKFENSDIKIIKRCIKRKCRKKLCL